MIDQANYASQEYAMLDSRIDQSLLMLLCLKQVNNTALMNPQSSRAGWFLSFDNSYTSHASILVLDPLPNPLAFIWIWLINRQNLLLLFSIVLFFLPFLHFLLKINQPNFAFTYFFSMEFFIQLSFIIQHMYFFLR